MKGLLMGAAVALLGCALAAPAVPAPKGEGLLVFISSFAPAPDGGIQAFRLDAAGHLNPAHRTPGIPHPFFIALSPDHRYLYSIYAPQFGGKENEEVAAFRVDAHSGELKALNRQSSRGTASCYLDVDATGKSVLLANYSTGSVAAFPVLKDGSLGVASTFVQHAGSSVNPARQEGPHAHSIVIGPGNKHVYAADLGLDQVVCYRLDAARAQLVPSDQPFVRTPPGAGPRHLTFDPSGRHLYAINELANSVTLFVFEPKTGRLIERQTISTLPAGFKGESYCADLKITPDGRYLYGTNRGHDSIAAYRIGEDGRLSLIEIAPSLGKGPQNLAITPNGKQLLCANMAGSNVAVFGIDSQTGKLASVGEPVELKGPSCIRIVP